MDNLVICVPGRGGTNPFSCWVADTLPDMGLCGSGTQCFPMFLFEEVDMQEFLNVMIEKIEEEKRKGLNGLFALGWLYAIKEMAEFNNWNTDAICAAIERNS